MKLTVKNFGPIHEAKNINVSPMTIFIGPSNTGKSYLAILIYSIMKTLEGNKIGSSFAWNYAMQKRIDETGIETFDSYKSKESMLLKVDELFQNWVQFVSDFWKEEVVYCFGEEGKNMMADAHNKNLVVKISDAKNSLTLDLTSPANSKLIHQKKKELLNQILKNEENPSTILNKILKEYRNKRSFSDYAHLVARVELNFTEAIYRQFFSILLFQQGKTKDAKIESHYLPAIRGGIMQSHRTLVSALIQQAPMAGLGKISPIPLFTGVLSDFMKKLINVAATDMYMMMRDGRHVRVNNNHKQNKINEIGKGIEQDIMEGSIDIRTSEAQYPDFRYVFERNKKKYDLPLMSVSSMVSELAPVSLFIRRYVNRGDLFIIEEPEAHLHPAAQREISNILVQLVNAGVHVLVTTHSDIILEQIGNYIHASDMDIKIEGEALNKGKISAYFFDRLKKSKHKNTVVKAIPYDPDTGILTKDHMDVSTALYNETVDLFNIRERNSERGKNK